MQVLAKLIVLFVEANDFSTKLIKRYGIEAAL